MVIWQTKTGEADRVITLLSGTGIITAYARSSLKPGAKLTGPTALLSYSNFELSSGKNMYTVTDAQEITRYRELEFEPEKFALAVYFCELLKLFTPEEDETARDYLRLMQNSLYLMGKSSKPLWQIKSVFELTIMTLSGYMPDLFGCASCGTERADTVRFDAGSASWTCSRCCNRAGIMAAVPFSCIDAMRYVISSDPRRAFAFTLPDEAVKEFAICCEQLVIQHADHKLPTLEFYHSLQD